MARQKGIVKNDCREICTSEGSKVAVKSVQSLASADARSLSGQPIIIMNAVAIAAGCCGLKQGMQPPKRKEVQSMRESTAPNVVHEKEKARY